MAPIPPQIANFTTYPIPLADDRWAYILVPGTGRFNQREAERMSQLFHALVPDGDQD